MTVKDFLIREGALHLFINCVVDRQLRASGNPDLLPKEYVNRNVNIHLIKNHDAINDLLSWRQSAVVLFPEEDGNRAFLQAQAYEFWSRLRSKYFKENNLTDPLL
jgi:hypothetical protein